MKRLLFASIAVAVLGSAVHAKSLNIDPNQSGAILIGISTTAPTQIFLNDSAATKTCVVNTSTNTIFFVGYSTTSYLGIATNAPISTNATTGSFSLPGSSANLLAQQFCFDGANGPYTGPIWAVSATGGGASAGGTGSGGAINITGRAQLTYGSGINTGCCTIRLTTSTLGGFSIFASGYGAAGVAGVVIFEW